MRQEHRWWKGSACEGEREKEDVKRETRKEFASREGVIIWCGTLLSQWSRFFTAERGLATRHEVDLVALLLGAMQHACIPIELQ
jgi:hypothetical protein